MMIRKISSAAIALVLFAGSQFCMAQGAPAAQTTSAAQAGQFIREGQPVAPVVTAPIAEQSAQPGIAGQHGAPAPQTAAVPVTTKSNVVAAGPESDELSILQKQAAVLKIKAEIAKYQADIRSAETRGQQGVPSGTPGQFIDPGVPAISGVQGTLPKMATAPAVVHQAKPELVHIGGADGIYTAIIEINGSTITDAVVGTQLDGGWKVVGIDAAHVKVARGKHVLVL